MALSKEQYFSMGCADAQTSPPNRQGHLYASISWQGRAYTEGFAQGAIYAAQARTAVKAVDAHVEQRLGLAPTAVQSIAPTAGETLEAGRAVHAAQVARMVPENKRADRIAAIARGYIQAAQFTGSDEENDTFDDIAPSDEAQAEAQAIATAFYDQHTADLGAYADLRQHDTGTDYAPRKRQLESYAFAGHDLCLTSQGHGVGFWDRGHGRLGKRLTKAAKAFQGVDVYVSDAGYLELSVPFHASWKRG